MTKDVLKEYAGILKKYMKKFGLEAVDISFLIKSTKENINALLSSSGNLELKSLEAIAQLFSLRYYEFGNPTNPIPSVKSLPEKTLARIEYRKRKGQSKETTYQQLHLNEKIIIVLSLFKINDEFIAQTIVDELNKESNSLTDVSKVTDRIKRSLEKYVEKTERQDITHSGSGPKPYFYRLIKEIPKSELDKALKRVGKNKEGV